MKIVVLFQCVFLTRLHFQFYQTTVPAEEDSLFFPSLAWRMLASTAATPAEFSKSFATGCKENLIVLSVSAPKREIITAR